MNRPTNAFNAIFFKELRDAYSYPLAVVGVLFLAGLLFAPWNSVPEASLSSLFPTIKEAAELLAKDYAKNWGGCALFAVFVLAALLPAGMFARERKTKEIACLERFPVSLQTVFLAKFSASFVLTALVAVGFVLIGFVFDLIYAKEAFTALTGFCAHASPNAVAFFKAFALCPLELLIWSAFWATAIRREAFVVAASLLSTFAVCALVGCAVGCVVAFGGDAPASLGFPKVWVLPRDLRPDGLFLVGGAASVESAFYAALRFGALLWPLVGIVRVFRRDGAQTTLGAGLDGLASRFATLLLKRRRPDAISEPASVPVDQNTSATSCERSTSVSARLADLTPRRLRPLTALCVETVESASLFGRFRGAILIDLALVNAFCLLASTADSDKGFALAALFYSLLFIVLFASGAFAGLRRDRSILTTRLPVSPRLYYASQLLTYAGLFVAAFLPTRCVLSFLHITPLPASICAYIWFVAFFASALVRSRFGAALACVLYYVAAFCLVILDITSRQANQTILLLFPLICGVASYFAVVRQFKGGRN